MNRAMRPLVVLAAAAIAVASCGSTATPAPSVGSTGAATTAPSSTPGATPTTGPATVPPGGPVTVKWFCCLGGGDDASTLAVFDQVIADFNASHPNIKLVLDHVAYAGARDAFATELASGNPPDVVGPLGVGGANAFEGQWLELSSRIQAAGVDLSGFDPGIVDLYKAGGGGQYGIPFAVYPSELYYQPDMFDEAGLKYPPSAYGQQYTMPDGSVADWSYDTVRTIAMKLTVDKNNKDATQAGFDPKSIVQYGFEPQRDDLRTMGAAYFAAGKFLADDGKTVQVPDAWKAAWRWVYDGIWKDHFIESQAVYASDVFNGGGYTFNSGKVAMQANYLWDVCCITSAGGNWNLGALPSYQGKVTAPLNADTFRITQASKHPDEAFTVLQYLVLGDARTKLLNSISGFPALTADQGSYFAQLAQQKDDKGKLIYPPNVNWQVAADGIKYADINPNSESAMPAYNQSLDTLGKYLTRWTSTPGLDMDTEFDKLRAELQAVWDAAK